MGVKCVKDLRDSVHGAVEEWKCKTSWMLHPRKPETASTSQSDLKTSNEFLNVKVKKGKVIALLLHGRGTRRGWVVSSTSRPHFTPRKDPVPILQEAGWPQGRSGRAENLVPTWIRSPTVQPVASRYTDWATGHTTANKVSEIKVRAE